jgi:hypothetical protein
LFEKVSKALFRNEGYFLLILSAIEKKKNYYKIVMKKIVMTAFLLLIPCIGVYGQYTVKGIILENTSKQPLKDVLIRVKNMAIIELLIIYKKAIINTHNINNRNKL